MFPNFRERTVGAFRKSAGISGRRTIFGRCEQCGLVYENRIVVVGLGSYSTNQSERIRRAEEDRLSGILRPMFDNPANRCTCDPTGDAEFLKERAEDEADRQRLKTSAPFVSQSDSLKGPASPQKADQDSVKPKPRSNKSIQQSLVVELQQLSDLYNAGALTRTQFEKAKDKLLEQ